MADRKSKDQEKIQRDVQDAWKEFTKDSKKAHEEIKEAFDEKNSKWTVGRVSTMIVVILLELSLRAVAVGLLRWLLI